MRGSLPVRCLLFLGAVVFGAFSWLQRNDVDPEIYFRPSVVQAALWLLFYALLAGLFLLSAFRPVPRWALALAALACLAQMAVSGPGLWQNLFGEADFTLAGQSMSAEDPRVELTREFFGALIALGGVAFLWWREVRERGHCQRSEPDPSGGSREK